MIFLFNLKHRPHTVYGGKIETLKKELDPKLRWAIAEAKRRQQGVTPERFSIRLHGKAATPGIKPENMAVLSGTVKQNTFRIPIHLRNDSFETLLGISHVYLFTSKQAAVVPFEYQSDFSQGALFSASFGSGSKPEQSRKAVPLEPFTANLVDAPDGLSEQYRLPITFPSVSPGAMEEGNLSLMFTGELAACDETCRLRLHSTLQYHDFSFILKVKIESEQASPSHTSPGPSIKKSKS